MPLRTLRTATGTHDATAQIPNGDGNPTNGDLESPVPLPESETVMVTQGMATGSNDRTLML
jgi:hypothetical protein